MPPWAIIVIVAIVMFTVAQIVSMASGRPLPWSDSNTPEVDQLKRRLEELEAAEQSEGLDEFHVPTKGEENMAAEDRWRLDMLEARLEELEKKRRHDDDA